MPTVVQSWLSNLSFRQQATVLSALRGCDGKSKHDPSKLLTRYFRGCILLPADPDHLADPHNNFMRPPDDVGAYAAAFLKDIDAYPLHWIMHFTHAAQILGYYHPDHDTKMFWGGLYAAIVHRLHLNTETYQQNEYRLRDGRRTPEEES